MLCLDYCVCLYVFRSCMHGSTFPFGTAPVHHLVVMMWIRTIVSSVRYKPGLLVLLLLPTRRAVLSIIPVCHPTIAAETPRGSWHHTKYCSTAACCENGRSLLPRRRSLASSSSTALVSVLDATHGPDWSWSYQTTH